MPGEANEPSPTLSRRTSNLCHEVMKPMQAMRRSFSLILVTLALLIALRQETSNRLSAAEQPTVPLIRSAQSGPWSAPTTWEGGHVPGTAARVQVREGHTVVYDVSS